jgi:hypothetical protein
MRLESLRCGLVRWTFVALVAACTAAPALLPDVPAPERPDDAERYYAIWLGGAQIGTAHETEQWSRTGVVVRRTEAMTFLRGDVPVQLATTIEITADRKLAPSLVTWTEHAQTVRHGQAARGARAWTVTDDAGVRRLPHDAIPAELVPLLVRRDGRFAGGVFLPARGFVAGTGRIDPIAPNRLVARLILEPAGAATAGAEDPAAREATAEATIDLGPDAMPSRVVDGEGVIAIRITGAQAAVTFEPVDVIAATSIPLAGSPTDRLELELDGELVLPAVPGQRPRGDAVSPSSAGPHPRGDALHAARATQPLAVAQSDAAPQPMAAALPGAATDVELELSPRLPGNLPPGPRGADRTRAIRGLVADVRDRIVPDLAANPTSARTAAAAIRGDCTTFALSYAALAIARAIPTLIVTGFRVDDDRLIRHRWAVSWTGRAWIAVDAAFGAVPAGGDLVGVAIHDADDIGLVAGEAALTHVRAATWK